MDLKDGYKLSVNGTETIAIDADKEIIHLM